MGGCSVVGCRNRFNRGKHFYRFPCDERRSIWIQFTGKLNFEPKNSSTICEAHFTKESFVKKKDRLHLCKNAVPQIYYQQTSLGLEMKTVQFDFEKMEYFGPESIDLLRGTISQEDVEQIYSKRQERIEELKSSCRFCFNSTKAEVKCVSISLLEVYQINIEQLGLKMLPENLCGDVLCEQCFQQIVEIDLFKKKCREAQEEILAEINELDAKIQEIQDTKSSGKSWRKSEIGAAKAGLSPELNATIEILEEHLVDDEEFQYEPEATSQEEFIEEILDINSGYKIVYQLPNQNSAQICLSEYPQDTEVELNVPEDSVSEPQIKREKLMQGVDEYAVERVTTDDIIKNPERNRFCFRIYECFFCKMKFAGRKTFVAHKCSVTEVKCQECDKVFNKIQAYNSHVSHIHGSLPISRNFCPFCKTVIMSTLNQFKQHRRQCNKESRDQPIECEICHKMLSGLKGYSVHKIFHDTRNFTTSTGEKIVMDGLNKGSSICEICGKKFNSSVGYRMHKRNVHRIGQPEDIVYQCDICSKIRPTKRSLFDHMRNTHRVQETPCTICGKVFRTKVLLKKHMMYHDETKRVFKCTLCPDKAGYFTNVALKRHQKSHIGSRDFQCDECQSAYTTNHQLKMHKLNKHRTEPN